MREIEKLRSEIDQLHIDLATLFRRRLQITERIWKIKKEQGLPFFDAEREQMIVHRFDAEVVDLDERAALQDFLKSVIVENKKYLEKKLK